MKNIVKCKITDPSDYIIANGAIKPREGRNLHAQPKKSSHFDNTRIDDNQSRLAGNEMPRQFDNTKDHFASSIGFIPTGRKPFNLYDQLQMHKNTGSLTSPRATIIPPADYNDGDDEDRIAMEAEFHLRKRFLCTQMVDCASVIDINSMKMKQIVSMGAADNWRLPHVLAPNLASVRDTVYTIGGFALHAKTAFARTVNNLPL
jgi:hypothetical protein